MFSYNERKPNTIPLGDIIYKVLRIYLVTVYGDKLLCRFIELYSDTEIQIFLPGVITYFVQDYEKVTELGQTYCRFAQNPHGKLKK